MPNNFFLSLSVSDAYPDRLIFSNMIFISRSSSSGDGVWPFDEVEVEFDGVRNGAEWGAFWGSFIVKRRGFEDVNRREKVTSLSIILLNGDVMSLPFL